MEKPGPGGVPLILDRVRAAMEGAGVARFKLPERLVRIEELATTKVGKIDKKALRADIVARLEGSTSDLW